MYWKFVILILLCLSACKNEPKLNGHWHLYDSSGDPVEMGTIDLIDSIGFFGKTRFEDRMKLSVDYSNKIITLHHLDIGGDYPFTSVGDTLKLGDVFYGIKTEDQSCHFETDYFAPSKLAIKLPLIKTTSDTESLSAIAGLDVFMGKPKLELAEKYGDSTRIEIGYRLIELTELEKENWKHRVKLNEKIRDKIYTKLFVHPDTKMGEIMKFVSKQRAINDGEIYLIGKGFHTIKHSAYFRFFPLEEIIVFDPEETLERWLKRRE